MAIVSMEVMRIQETCYHIHSLCVQAKRILVVSHENCGDATGALLAFGGYLADLGVSYELWLPGPVGSTVQFLPGAVEVAHTTLPALEQFDMIVSLDAADEVQAGLENAEFKQWQTIGNPLVVIDHHYTNTGYGTVNWINPHAAATCAMLYDYFFSIKQPITRKMATCLLTGILTDTGSFSNAATNQEALSAASELLIRGAPLATIIRHTFKAAENLALLRLWGRVLSRIRYRSTYGMAIACITQHDLRMCGLTENDLDGMANVMNVIKDIRVGLLLTELSDGTIKGSLRTTRDDIDVAQFAAQFGGGGHQRAAGFKLPGRFAHTKQGLQII